MHRILRLWIPLLPALLAVQPAMAQTRDTISGPFAPRAIKAPRAVLEGPLAERLAVYSPSAAARVSVVVRSIAPAYAPANGHGTVRVFVAPDGSVSAVTSTSPSWDGAAQAIRDAFAAQNLPPPPGGRPMTLRFAVDAEVVWRPLAFDFGVRRKGMILETHVIEKSILDGPPPFIISPLWFLPLRRHFVKVEPLGEEPD